MAIVNITGKLVDDIKTKFRTAQRVRWETLVEPLDITSEKSKHYDEMMSVCADLVYKDGWGEFECLKTVMPAKWLNRVDGMSIRVQIGDKRIGELRPTIPGGYSMPPDWRESWHIVDMERPDVPAHLKDAATAWIDANVAHEAQYKATWEAIRTFLNSCKHLNEALRAKPEIAAYIPAEYIARVNKKVERVKSAASALADVDLSHAVAVATLGELMKKGN
jgi:hypothetical protein